MKKIIFILSLIFSAFIVNAQSTSPRFGTRKNDDNSGRVLTWSYKTAVDATGADSVTVVTSAYNTTYRVSLTDSICFKTPVLKNAYAGDVLIIVASGTNGNKVKFYGANIISAGTATLSTSARAIIRFIFDGANWVESDRTVL